MSENKPAPVAQDAPLGAIINGRTHMDRLEGYPFECEAGPLTLCTDWVELRRCFEHLADSCAAAADRIDRLGETVERLTLVRDALLVDAERYRWLRARPLDDDEIFIAVDSAKHPTRWGLGGSDPDGCDAAIDAARSAE